MGLYLNGNKIAGNNLVDSDPVGKVIFVASNNIPNGYLYCDGREVNRITYKALFNAIGTTYGAGDGSTTFNLPDLRNNIIYGDGDNEVGKKVDEELPNVKGGSLTGSASPYGVTDAVGTVGQFGMLKYSTPVAAWTDKNDGSNGRRWVSVGFDLSKGQVNADGTTYKSTSVYKNGGSVKVKGITLKPCIKYLNSVEKLESFLTQYPVGAKFESYVDSCPEFGTWEKVKEVEEYNDDRFTIKLSISHTKKYEKSTYLGNNLWAYQAWFQSNQSVATGIIQIGNTYFDGVAKAVIEQQLTGANGWTPECFAINNGAFYKCGSGTMVSGTNIHLGGTVYVQDTTPDRIKYIYKRIA